MIKKYMPKFLTFLFLLTVLTTEGIAQSLTIDETIEYINKLSIENPNEGRFLAGASVPLVSVAINKFRKSE